MADRPATPSDVIPLADAATAVPGGTPSGRNHGQQPLGGAASPVSRRNGLPVLPLTPPTPPPEADADVSAVPPFPELSEETDAGRTWPSLLLGHEMIGGLTSGVVHAGALLVFALVAVTHQAGQGGTSLVASTTAAEPMDELEQLEWQIDPPGAGRVPGEATMPDAQAEAPEVAVPQDRQAGSGNPWATSVGLELATPADWLSSAGAPVGGGLAGRGRAARAALAGDGGTPQSEDAVERGLRWLAAHQRDDGGWSFNLQNGLCHGMCRNPGTVGSTTAATALALAPFLGAGYTHMEGEHREVVKRGLYYLVRRALLTPEGADLQEGTMYAQGLSAIVLCEAYAMTGDAGLREVAQKALDFIVYAQDQRGGGWRYTPGEPGDTTVTGWQLMALKSGQMARLNVPSPNIYLAQRFLDGVQTDGGAQYGYMTPEPRRTTTAIGLLCRMYGGWPRSHPGLAKGVKLLGQWGPSPDDIYYDYYATQVMRHWEGPEWSKWNPAMRDYLVKTQAREGHESGSWYFSGGHAESGGRLYVTAMAVMTLEVYYRYMPLYRAPAFEADRGGEHP